MRRIRARYLVLGLAATLVIIWAFQWYFDPSITAADVDRIRPGMTLAEVLAILRSLPANVNGRSVAADADGHTWVIDEMAMPRIPPRPEMLYRLEWERGSGVAIVFFDDRGNVYGKGYYQSVGSPNACESGG